MANKQGTNAVLDNLAQGTFGRTNVLTADQTWTAGTERKIASIGSEAARQLIVYLTWRFQCWNDTGVPMAFEWYVVKISGSDSPPDFSDSDVFETYMRDKKIFARGNAYVGHQNNVPPVIKLKFFNIPLEVSEYLELFVTPKITSGAEMTEWVEQEKRQIVLD